MKKHRACLKLAGLPRRAYGVDPNRLLNQARETRNLRIVVISSRVMNDLDLHGSNPVLIMPTSKWLMKSMHSVELVGPSGRL